MSDFLYSQEDITRGLALSGSPLSATQATGLGGLAETSADQALLRDELLAASRARTAAPGLRVPTASQAPAYYNPTTNQLFAAGRTFDIRDVNNALGALQQGLTPSPAPQGAGWEPLSGTEFAGFVESLGRPRGTGELLARGTRAFAGGLVGGVGRGIEMLGAPETGGAIAEFGETIAGQDEFDRQRSALIQQRQSLGGNIISAAIESLPTLLGSVGAAAGGGAVGGLFAGPVGAAAGATVATAATTLARARTIGAFGGAVVSSFPQQLNQIYEAAGEARTEDDQPVYDRTNPQVQREIFAAALFNTTLDVLAPGIAVSQVLRSRIRQSADNAVQGLARARAVGGAALLGAIGEAATEGIQTVVEQAVFDPEFRRQLSASDWQALAPYIVERYGEAALIGAGAGAILGGGLGGGARFLTTGRPRDILQDQGAPPPPPVPPAPPPGPEQGELFPGAPLGTPPILGDRVAIPPAPLPGTQGELFPGAPTARAPLAPGVQGDLFAPTAPTVPPGPVPTQLPLPFSDQGELFPGAPVTPSAAPTLAPTPAAAPPPPGAQLDLFGLASRPAPTMPPPVVAPGAPTLAPTSFVTPEMERLRRPIPPPAPPVQLGETDVGNRLLALRRQLELQQAEAQRAAQPTTLTAAERDFDAALAQAAENTPVTLDTAAVVTGTNRAADNARRSIVEQFNRLTKAQQDEVLAGYDNDPATFLARVRSMPAVETRRLRNQIGAIAETTPGEPVAAPATTLAPELTAPPAAPAPPVELRRGRTRAAEEGQVPGDRLRQRQTTPEGGAAPEAGRGNRTLRRRPQQAQAEEVTAPAVAPAVAPAPPPVVVDTSIGDRLNEQIDRAAASGANAGRNLTTLRNDLIQRRERDSALGRSTGELTQAIERIDGLLATPTATGALPPEHPQSRWAQVMDDEGVGYNNLSPEGRQEWDRIVASNVPLTPELARDVDRRFPTQETVQGTRFVETLKRRLNEADDLERVGKVIDQLEKLAESSNPVVAEAARQALGRDTGQFSLVDWNTTGNVRNADGSIPRPVAPGRVRMVVQNFLSKLATKPKVTVVANQQELQRTNPALYARANAARPQGDFATANAAGYSFGDGEVIIFTDRIVNEQHLRFVLAHETLGHFGMRGILPKRDFDAAMDRIYETDSRARAAADAAMEVRGLSKAEAVEEYLADFAALLDTSTVARVWNAIKRTLSSLGVRSGDSATRYFLDQSRRYVREGRQGVAFDAQAVAQRLHEVETGEAAEGRYSPDAAFSAGSLTQVFRDRVGAWPTSVNDMFDSISAAGKNIADVYDSIKAKFFSLSNFRALENAGLYEFNQLMGRINQIAMSTKDGINEYLRPVMNASNETKARISRVMYAGRSYKIANMDRAMLRGKALFSIDERTGDIVQNVDEVESLFKAGLLSLDQIRNGFSYSHTTEGADGKPVTFSRKFDGIKDFSEEDYQLYVRTRRAMASVELDMAQAEYSGYMANRRISSKELGKIMTDGKFGKEDRAFLDAFVKKYGEIYTKNAETNPAGIEVFSSDSMREADRFIAAVNRAFIGRDTDRNADIYEYFDSRPAADAFIDQMMATKARRVDLSGQDRFDLQAQVKQLFLETKAFENAERRARRALITGYTPAMREGQWQMRLQAFIGNKPVEVKDTHQELLAYSQFGTRPGAETMTNEFNKALSGQTFDLLVRGDDGTFSSKKVTLRAITAKTVDTVSTDPRINLQDFLYGMRRFGIDANTAVMEKLVTTLTRQENAARNRLEFSDTPGYDLNGGIYAISRHIEARASAIARTYTRPVLRDLMNLDSAESRALWSGNEAYVEKLRQEVESTTGEARKDAQRRLDRAEYMLRNSRTKDGTEVWQKYYNEAVNTMSFLEGNKFVDESDFGAGPIASRVRAYTSMAQLGGSIAQGVLNGLSVYTNWMPYMASYNSKNGFGGGFGIGRAQAEYHRALTNIGAPGLVNMAMNRANFYDAGPKPKDPNLAKGWKPGVAQDPALQKRYGITEEEAKVIAREIRDGKLIPAQSNSLIATARGYTTNPLALKFIDGFMSPFNLSEQAARRSAFLAAYRLFRDRALAAGKSVREASQEARDAAVESIDFTLGDYTVLNRPPAWRGGIQSFLYMYKTYPTTVIQLLANLNRKGQLGMLAGLWVLAGTTGLPFAEDLEDIIDTLAQQLGFQQGSIRGAIARHIDEHFPGMSPRVLRGLVNEFGLADVAARTSAGNFLPGTGAFLAGTNVAREMSDILGPAAGFISGFAGTARDIITYPTSAGRSLEDIARSSPVTALRMLGDGYAYTQAGAVIDRRGYVVSPDMDAGTVLTRLLGFYPEAASRQYDIIRIAQRETDYQREVTAAFRQRWVSATMRGDSDTAQNILDAVRSWNEGARGTPYEVRNFLMNSQRALREARRSATERTLRATPTAAREDVSDLVDALLR
jgi:hypothetical protein